MKVKTIQQRIQGNLTVTLYLKALPMKNGINFRAMVALRTASYKHNNNKNKTIYKIRDGNGGEVTTGFRISHYIDKCICLQKHPLILDPNKYILCFTYYIMVSI